MGKLLMISLDALADTDFMRLAALPNTSCFIKEAALVTGVMSTMITNTYPVHASVITGQLPCQHGLISNYAQYLDTTNSPDGPLPAGTSHWACDSRMLRARTLWQAASQAGFTVASVMWPVTGYSRDINWNIPEAMAAPGSSQILTSLRTGSKLVQIGAFLRHRHHLSGISQPGVDRFSTRAALDIIRRHRPDLALLHLTAYDSLCHHYGRDDARLAPVLEVMDEHLGMLLDAIDLDTTVLLLSDHAQLNVRETIDLTDWTQRVCPDIVSAPPSSIVIEQAGGSAFYTCKAPSQPIFDTLLKALQREPFFNRALTAEEMNDSGYAHSNFGVCAKPTYAFGSHHEPANHGYPPDYQDYQVFYAARGPRIRSGERLTGGSLLDIAPLAARILGVSMPDASGRIAPGILDEQ